VIGALQPLTFCARAFATKHIFSRAFRETSIVVRMFTVSLLTTVVEYHAELLRAIHASNDVSVEYVHLVCCRAVEYTLVC
jgi:hypothetical protein